MCTRVPVPMPSAAALPARQPWVALRVMISNESGPGRMLSRSPEMTNSGRSWMPNISVARAQLARHAHELVELGQRGAGRDRGARTREAVLDRRCDAGRVQ